MTDAAPGPTQPTEGRAGPDVQVEAAFTCRGLTLGYGDHVVVRDLDLEFPEKRITAIIGPSGCGKSTLVRTLNRMNDFIPSFTKAGTCLYRGVELYDPSLDPVLLRRQVGMVFQKPNPFPKTILQNVTWGPMINGYTGDLRELAVESLQKAALWGEVAARLDQPALSLSGGQQQRLCIARTLAMQPDVILMDEPCSSLDPVSTSRIEELMDSLRERYTIVIVTHNMQQAARISDLTAFLEGGDLVEFGDTDQIFTRPLYKRTEDYVTGRFG